MLYDKDVIEIYGSRSIVSNGKRCRIKFWGMLIFGIVVYYIGNIGKVLNKY